jgi:hypothetical protein
MHATTPNAQNIPTGAYPTPSFATPSAVDPNTFVQAMSFMATPVGAQSMAAFASHMAGAASSPAVQFPPSQHTPPLPRYPHTQQSGQKRKWEDGKSNTQAQPQRKPQQPGSKPPRAKAAVPPTVPAFGFSLPTPSSAPASSHPSHTKGSRKGRVRLGLTHEEMPEESSEEEDVDEEVALGAKLKGGGYAFEHEGEQISLQTTGDIAEWIKDRRRNFPTYQKAMEKAQAAATKRKNELEFVRKLKGKPLQPVTQDVKKVVPKNHERTKKDEKKQEELAALRKKLHESMMKKKESSVAVDLGLGYGSATDSEAESSVLSESSVVSSSDDSSEDSDGGSDESDGPPEPTSSKVGPPAIKVPPPPVAASIVRKPDKEKMCNSWKQYGKCPFGHSCRFKHIPKQEKRTGLYEKLVEQELVKTDQLALEAIKYLGQNGFLG